MPHHCIVPKCSHKSGKPESKGVSFYRLPLKNKKLLKQWLIKIRRENTPLTQHSRVCSVHFKGGKKSGKNDVPEIFQWTKTSTRQPPKVRVNLTESDETIDIPPNEAVSSTHQSKSTQTSEDDIQGAALVSHMSTMIDSELMGCTEEVDSHDIESTPLTEAVSLGESIEASEDIQGTALQVSHVGTMTDSEIVGVISISY